MPLVCAQAAIYAARNRATITDCQHDQYDIKVQVVGNDELQKIGDTEELDGDHAQGQGARHAVELRQRRRDPRRRRRQPPDRRRGRRLADGRQPAAGGLRRRRREVRPASSAPGLRPNSITTNGNHSLHDTGCADRPRGAQAATCSRSRSTPRRTGAASSRSSSTRRWASASRTASRSRSRSGAPPRTPSTSTTSTSPTPTRPTPATWTRAARPGAVPAAAGASAAAAAAWRPRRLRPAGPPRALGRPGRARRPTSPARPTSFPANLRQIFFNIMICESGGNPNAIEEPGRQRRPARPLRPLPVRHPDLAVRRRPRRPEGRVARGAVDAGATCSTSGAAGSPGSAPRRQPPQLRLSDEPWGERLAGLAGADARRRADAARRAHASATPPRPGQDDAAAGRLWAADPQVQLDPHLRHALRPGPRVAGP